MCFFWWQETTLLVRKKKQTSSPAACADSLMLMTCIEAKEVRDTSTTDIKGECLHEEQDYFAAIKFEDDQVEVMWLIEKSYSNYDVEEGDHKTLYLVLNKALCGAAKAAFSWCNLLINNLVENGFKLNLYDLCTADTVAKEKQCNIKWHVDDTSVSHVDSDAVDDVICMLESKFGKMKVVRGSCH